MFKKFANIALGGLMAVSIWAGGNILLHQARALVGTQPPAMGFNLTDSQWLLGLAGGLNNIYVYGLTAAGTTQATCSQIPSGDYLVEIDTAAASSGMCLPTSVAGTDMLVYNNGAQTVTIYPAVANNPATGAQDTINNTTSVTITSHNSQAFSSAKTGIWFSK